MSEEELQTECGFTNPSPELPPERWRNPCTCAPLPEGAWLPCPVHGKKRRGAVPAPKEATDG